ncbi:MAG TPA: aminoacyl-tRNA hydrolase [Candidatus Moranbacteria bacterium]|nr:aminoacyl-tRNA hydrolase [Candidatus Moranbacteria bacterium]
MKLIVGLGNPGKEYEKTRHNAGFIMIDKIRENYNFPDFKFEKKFNAEISISNFPPLPSGEDSPRFDETSYRVEAGVRRTGEGGASDSQKTILAKPQTFMNRSGEAVKAILDFYKLAPEDLVVIHDDIDIEIGKHKISSDSGSAGHNGVADIIEKLGTQNFKRIRIGAANEKLRAQIDPSDFVLQKFSEEELDKIEKVLENILKEISETKP